MIEVIYTKKSEWRCLISDNTVENQAEVAAYYGKHTACSLEIVNVLV